MPTYQDIKDRIVELDQLEDGWLDGEQGKSIDKEGLVWLQGKLLGFKEELLPWVFPSSYQAFDVVFEWTIGAWEISLWIDVISKQADWYGDHINGNSTFWNYDLSQEEAWDSIKQDLKEL